MTGPQHRPSPGPRGDDRDGARPSPSPSPRPRHGFDEDAFPEDSYQGGYPDLRGSRPVERATPTDPEGFGELYGGTGPQPSVGPTAYAAPVRYEGYGAAVPAGTPQRPADDAGYGRASHRMPEAAQEETGYDRGRAAYGEYGDPESRGGTAIDGGPPYAGAAIGYRGSGYVSSGAPVAPADPADAPYDQDAPAEPSPAAQRHDDADPAGAGPRYGTPGSGAAQPYAAGPGTAGGGTAVAERTGVTDEPAAPTGSSAVPAPRTPSDPGGRRPATVAEAAAARFGGRGTPAPSAAAVDSGAEATGPNATAGRAGRVPAPGAGTAVTVARDPRALTVLRVVTYVLVSLCCLVFLASVVYGVVLWFELRGALGASPLFGGSPAGTF
ncbi:hypothetical protein [Pseudonocardia spirodelae]|uniref:Uncharacterized protein n=1 Tax=Pseudonocardia spirodelae TaxID=3133431 RepID=A0ABU8TAS7_9PSEU